MGLRDIFSRRSDKDLHRRIKAQPYDSTYPSVPPLKGTYPIAGNGPNVLLGSFIASQTKLNNKTQLSLDQKQEPPAPAPFIPRFREEDIERPSSAPHGGPPAQWLNPINRPRKEISKGGPPVSLHKSRAIHQASQHVPQRHQASTNDISNQGAMSIGQSQTRYASSARSRTSSIRSGNSRGFVDILDAQSRIKAPDFRSRVQATGARDYGEDVADRNIGENGHNLDSTRVQAFYAAASEQAHSEDQASEKTSSHYNHTDSLQSHSFPKRTSSRLPVALVLNSGNIGDLHTVEELSSRVARPEFLNTDASDSISTARMNTSRTRVRSTGLRKGIVLWDRQMNTATEPTINHDSQPVEDNVDWPLVMDRPAHVRTSRLSRAGGDSISHMEAKKSSALSGESLNGISSDGESSEAAYTFRPTSGRGSMMNSNSTSPMKPFTKEHTIKSSISSSIASQDTATGVTSLAHPRSLSRASRNEEGLEEHEHDGTGSLEADKFGINAKSRRRHVDSRDDNPSYPNSINYISSARRSQLSEIYEHVPMRTSSAHHRSSSSVSGTGSTTSSNPFARPPSRHTADTSVDSRQGLSNAISSSQSSLGSPGRKPRSHPTKSVAFNIDDQLSSDDDDDTSPRRPRGEGEEELLFKEGFGLDGAELPGLGDGFGGAVPPPSLSAAQNVHRPRSPSNSRAGTPFPSQHLQRPQQRRYILDTAADDPDSDSEDSFYGEAAGSSSRRSVNRLSAIGSLHGHNTDDLIAAGGLLEEEREVDKVDFFAAARMRKEAKMRMRAVASEQRRREKGKEVVSESVAVGDELPMHR